MPSQLYDFVFNNRVVALLKCMYLCYVKWIFIYIIRSSYSFIFQKQKHILTRLWRKENSEVLKLGCKLVPSQRKMI